MKIKNIIYLSIFIIFIFAVFPSFNKVEAADSGTTVSTCSSEELGFATFWYYNTTNKSTNSNTVTKSGLFNNEDDCNVSRQKVIAGLNSSRSGSASSSAFCGSANGGAFSTTPRENLCANGSRAFTFVSTASGWKWTCSIPFPKDIFVSCNATKKVTKKVNKNVGSKLGVSTKGGGGLVPNCPNGVCGFEELMILINNVIKFLLFDIATPLAALAFAYAGFLLLTAGGDPGKSTRAKAIIRNVLIGFAIALAAWLIVNTIFSSLGFTHSFLSK